MINLLPTTIKQDIAYGRRNQKLRRWIIASVAALAGVGVIVVGGLLYINQSINQYTDQLAIAKQSLESQNMEATQKRVSDISSNTKLATQVLSREILFSKLLPQIASALPPNTALSSLQIEGVQGGLQLDASAADFNAATQIQVNLQDPKNGVFEKADINDITCGDDSTEEERLYPCTVSIRALFGKNNSSFLYIAPTPGAKQ